MEQIQERPQQQTKLISGVPEQYFTNELLNKAIKLLPPNYNFEVEKTLYRIDQLKKDLGREQLRVSLQFPEGLMLFGCLLSDILSSFSKCETVILGDLTYGACCVDDIASNQLQCDLLVHYAHSCLVPITETIGKILYVFVEMQIDVNHLVETIQMNFPDKNQEYHLLGTIQFNTAIFQTQEKLAKQGYHKVTIPQEKPRSAGEVLGCTSPSLNDPSSPVIFVCDGRFHMESSMIANPQHTFYQYNPYSRELTIQQYDNKEMMRRRHQEIARAASGQLKKFAFIFGTLGRQGNLGILNRMKERVPTTYSYFVLLVSEVNDHLLTLLKDQVDFFVQVSCPRLSIDWGYKSPKPLLAPYEFFVLAGAIEWRATYPMDYYSNNGGEWTNYFGRITKSNWLVMKNPHELSLPSKSPPKISDSTSTVPFDIIFWQMIKRVERHMKAMYPSSDSEEQASDGQQAAHQAHDDVPKQVTICQLCQQQIRDPQDYNAHTASPKHRVNLKRFKIRYNKTIARYQQSRYRYSRRKLNTYRLLRAIFNLK